MRPEDGGRAGLGYRPADRLLDGICLRGSRDDAEKVIRGTHSRDSQGYRVFRNLGDVSETSVMHLLKPAFLIQVHLLDLKGIIEVGHMGVIECDILSHHYPQGPTGIHSATGQPQISYKCHP